jgi:energy-coupling factor transporter ATP-binding protein EcfA2
MADDRPALHDQTTLLTELVALSTFCAETETSIKQVHEQSTSRISREAELDLAHHEESTARVRRELVRARDAELEQLTQGIDKEERDILNRISADRERLTDKADRNTHEARKGLQEALWATETVYEAKEHLPREAFEQTEKLIEQNRRGLDDTRERAEQTLRRYRMRGLATLFDVPLDEGYADIDFAEQTGGAHEALQELRTMALPRMLIGIKLPLLFLAPVVAAAVVVGVTFNWAATLMTGGIVAGVAIVTAVVLFIVFRIARTRVQHVVARMATSMRASAQASIVAMEQATRRRAREERELLEHRDNEIRLARSRFMPIIEKIESRRAHHLERLDTLERDERKRLADERHERTASTSASHEALLTEHDRATAARRKARTKERDDALAAAHQAYESAWSDFEKACLARQHALERAVESMQREVVRIAPDWNDRDAWESWSPPKSPPAIVPFGHFNIDRRTLPGGVSSDERLATSLPVTVNIPASLELPERCSLLLQCDADGREKAVRTLQNVALRVLTALPPGKVRFTVIDPVGLGQSFAALMHLADYEEAQIIDKIWTETKHIEQRLVDLTEHMENVIQKYLRNEFQTIDEYNEAANEIAEPYRFLIISDFPANFSDTAMRRLSSIASSGARCGVYTLIAHDTRASLPSAFDIGDLERNSLCLEFRNGTFIWDEEPARELPLVLEAPPSDVFATTLLHRLGQESIEASRVEVPFAMIRPDDCDVWASSTSQDVRVPLGRAGATKLQYMTLGRGTSQHVLIAGKTGSGKSTLLHAMITNLALIYSPDEVQFYLIDFKKGVEFKPYASYDLPHARAVAIESDREFGLSVLERIDEELKRRGNLFRDVSVQDLPGFRVAQPDVAMPRILLVIDEFQELFVDDDKLAQDASLLLDRLVRQGRAFGIHVILGSQTLGGAYSLARSTIGQMAVRVALQCSENDAYLIMSDDNSAARLLSRPGEAIYNDASGLVEGNNPFQVAWLPDAERETALRMIRERARTNGFADRPPAMVFEGNIPADVRRNHLLSQCLANPSNLLAPTSVNAWLGDAIAIKDPTAAALERHSGANVLIVGQRDDAALAMMTVATVSLAAQLAVGTRETGLTRFVVLDGSSPDAFAERYWPMVLDAIPHAAQMVSYRDVPDILAEIVREIGQRQDDNAVDRPGIVLMIYGLQRYRVLRPTDDFSFSANADTPPAPDKLLATILRDGPAFGVHTFAWCDTMNNLSRSLERQELREFERRVLFQMSATDSANLIDSPVASRLGLQRALFFSEERGTLEKFRPYAVPEEGWLDEVRLLLESSARIESPESQG